MRHLHLLIITLATLMLGACTKNDFTVKARFTGSKNNSVLIAYRASDKARSFVVDRNIDLLEEGFTLKGITRYPTVVWIFCPFDGKLLMPVYAERGDELSITGDWQEPQKWKCSGNEVMEEYSAWSAANFKALKSNEPAAINKAVATFVKEHPDRKAAAFILFTRYVSSGHEAEFMALTRQLDLDEDDLKEMKAACMLPSYTPPASPRQLPAIKLPDLSDSVVSLPSGKRLLLHFWRQEPAEEMKSLLRRAAADTTVTVVGIFMDTDTARCCDILRTDSTMRADLNLRAIGGEVNPVLKPLGITLTPSLILTDRQGKILYKGSDPKSVKL